MILGMPEVGWLWFGVGTLAAIIGMMLCFFWGIQYGLEIFSKKLDTEVDKRMNWYLENRGR